MIGLFLALWFLFAFTAGYLNTRDTNGARLAHFLMWASWAGLVLALVLS